MASSEFGRFPDRYHSASPSCSAAPNPSAPDRRVGVQPSRIRRRNFSGQVWNIVSAKLSIFNLPPSVVSYVAFLRCHFEVIWVDAPCVLTQMVQHPSLRHPAILLLVEVLVSPD